MQRKVNFELFASSQIIYLFNLVQNKNFNINRVECIFLWHCRRLLSFLLECRGTLWAVPLPLWLGGEVHAPEVEPLDGTVLVVAADHLAVADLVAEAVHGLVGVDRHVQHLLGHRQVRVETLTGSGGGLILLLLLLLPFLLQTFLLVLRFLLDRNLFLLLCFRLR